MQLSSLCIAATKRLKTIPGERRKGTGGRWLTVAALSAVVAVATLVRLQELTKAPIGHIEMYVPGIELPYDLAEPRPRLTITTILTGTVAAEPHPPAYYILMLGWTRWFGTGVLALRLPSALFGVASVILLYVLGRLERDPPTALLAAAMLALNGECIYWSQIAKMNSMACFLGLLSTVLLLLISRSSGVWQRVLLWFYLAATVTGLGTIIFFWPIFITQVLWSLRGNWKERTSVPAIVRWQILTFVVASPLWGLAAYQARRSSYLEEKIWTGLTRYFQIGFLFEPDPWALLPESIPPIAAICLTVIGAFLFALGLASSTNHRAGAVTAGGPPVAIMALAGLLSLAVVLVFAVVAHKEDPSRTPLIVACGAIPALLVASDVLLRRYWNRICRWGTILNETLPGISGANSNSLASLLSILPVSMIIAASFHTLIFAPRGVMLYSPYLILVVSSGVVWLGRSQRRSLALGGLVIAAALIGIHGLSAKQSKQRLRHPNDFKALAEMWAPVIRESDLIFVRRHWAMTPIFYYLKGDRYHFVGANYAEVTHEKPASRVWVLVPNGLPIAPEVKAALQGYRQRETVASLRLRAVLYDRGEPAT